VLPDRLLVDVTHLTRVDVTDDYGASVPGEWTSETIRARLEQRSADEINEAGREASQTEWIMWANTALSASDRVEWQGLTFEIEARARPRQRFGGDVHHWEHRLRLVEG
jgi:head-tail adaptor